MGAVFNPQIEVSQDGKTKYSFTDLETEKRALENYRNSIDISRQKLGETVFDSNS
jgi:heme oxygenase